MTGLASEFATLARGAQPPAISPYYGPEIQRWALLIRESAEANDLDPDLVAAVIQVESAGDPEAVSSAGALGLMQVMPFHWRAGEDTFDPAQNIAKGCEILAGYIRLAGGDLRLGLRSYYSGPTGAAKGGGYDYLYLVLDHYRKARAAR